MVLIIEPMNPCFGWVWTGACGGACLGLGAVLEEVFLFDEEFDLEKDERLAISLRL